MLAKACAVLALAGSAAAFAPTMSLSANRRDVIAGAGAAAVVAPLLRPEAAVAKDKYLRAPVITIFDARGCKEHANREYDGPKSNDENDEMCVKVRMEKIAVADDVAKAIKLESLSELKKYTN
uniref:Phycoerythrin alpha subunit n=1 Tax=Chroomonas mesostigmatica TaxID=195065 RepID=A0A067YSJ4_9CRYP|nr:phycoerythrin alpha subunit [Chroomonas mesostigmatica]